MSQAQIFIPWLGPTLNQIWAGKHWGARRRIARQAHAACVVAKGVEPFTAPVSLVFQAQHGKGRPRLDCSNYAVSCKALEDGLVEIGVLPGDSFKQVVSVAMLAPVKGAETGMWITITARPEAEIR